MPSPEPHAPAASPAPSPSLRRAVVVLGMHRSGTSAVAGCLRWLGVDFGPRLMPPTADNERGYYEHVDIVNLHDRLLLAAGSSWHDTAPRPAGWLSALDTARFQADLRHLLRRDFGSAPLWGVKDPRLCRLLPWWEPQWAQMDTRPLFVIVLRDPRQVAASLERRDGFSPGKAYLLWLLHILEAERTTRAADRVFVDFADFLHGWQAALAPIGALLGQPWPVSPSVSRQEEEEEPFVDQALANRFSGGGGLPAWVEELDTTLRRDRQNGPEMFAVMDRLAGQVSAAQALYGSAQEQESDLRRELVALQQQARWYEEEWQKARRRLEGRQEEMEREAAEVLLLKNRILVLERVVANMRMHTLSDVRKRQGVFTAFLHRWFHF